MSADDKEDTVQWVMRWLKHRLAVFTPEEESELTRMMYDFVRDNPGMSRKAYLDWAEKLLKNFIRPLRRQ